MEALDPGILNKTKILTKISNTYYFQIPFKMQNLRERNMKFPQTRKAPLHTSYTMTNFFWS